MEAVLRGADALRAAVWRLTVRTRLGRACVRERSLRLAVIASAQIALALGLTVWAPLWLLLLGPIVLGVPHAVSDVRYLLVQQVPPPADGPRASRARKGPGGLTTRAALAIVFPLGLMTLLRVALLLGAPPLPEAEVLLGAATVAVAVSVAPATAGARALGFALAALLAGLGLWQAHAVALWLGHAHNFVGLGLWLVWARGDGPARHRVLPVALVAAGVALLGTGALAPAGTAPAAGLDLGQMLDTLAPGFGETAALRLVLVYAFAQAVHYTVWLRLVPGTRAPGAAPASFRKSLAALTADLGPAGTACAALLSLAVPAFALFDAARARSAYLTLVLFHGWLEIAIIAFLATSRLASRRARA